MTTSLEKRRSYRRRTMNSMCRKKTGKKCLRVKGCKQTRKTMKRKSYCRKSKKHVVMMGGTTEQKKEDNAKAVLDILKYIANEYGEYYINKPTLSGLSTTDSNGGSTIQLYIITIDPAKVYDFDTSTYSQEDKDNLAKLTHIIYLNNEPKISDSKKPKYKIFLANDAYLVMEYINDGPEPDYIPKYNISLAVNKYDASKYVLENTDAPEYTKTPCNADCELPMLIFPTTVKTQISSFFKNAFSKKK
jgi:hypothetical protein